MYNRRLWSQKKLHCKDIIIRYCRQFYTLILSKWFPNTGRQYRIIILRLWFEFEEFITAIGTNIFIKCWIYLRELIVDVSICWIQISVLHSSRWQNSWSVWDNWAEDYDIFLAKYTISGVSFISKCTYFTMKVPQCSGQVEHGSPSAILKWRELFKQLNIILEYQKRH